MNRAELRVIAQAKAKAQYDASQEEQGIKNQVPPSSVRIGERDPLTGKDEVIYENEGQEMAGKRVFNASLPNGSQVRSSRPYGESVVALGSKSAFSEEDESREKKVKVQLDAAILYAVREEKDYPVQFINPTWEIQVSDDGGYICVPVPDGNKGEYPDAATCMQFAQNYWQEAVDNIDAQYEAEYTYWETLMNRRDNALSLLPDQIDDYYNATIAEPNSNSVEQPPIVVGYAPFRILVLVPDIRYSPDNFPLTLEVIGNIRSYIYQLGVDIRDGEDSQGNPLLPPVRQPNPVSPILKEPNKFALNFFYKPSLKAESINLNTEINQNEAFEAIFIKDGKNTGIPILKIGREKDNYLSYDGMQDSSGSGNGGSSEYWKVIDLESWHQISFFYFNVANNNDQYNQEVFYYDLPIFAKDAIKDNYQNWRFASYQLYPNIPQNRPCETGFEYQQAQETELKYAIVVDYQSLTNENNNFLFDATAKPSFNGKSYNFNCIEVNKMLGQENLEVELTKSKILDSSTTCTKQRIFNQKKKIKFPANTVFFVIKPF